MDYSDDRCPHCGDPLPEGGNDNWKMTCQNPECQRRALQGLGADDEIDSTSNESEVTSESVEVIHLDDGLDMLNVDLESRERTREVLNSLAASGIQFEDGTIESLNLRRVTVQDKELLYTQRYEPRCKFCSHPLRDQAEALWLESGRNVERVREFMIEHDGPRSWDAVNNHLEKHCEWQIGPAINFLARVRNRQQDLSEIRSNELQFSIDALNSVMLDVARFSLTDDLDQSTKIARTISTLMDSKLRVIKMQSEMHGAHAQAESKVAAVVSRVTDFLRNLLGVLEDPKQKSQVLELINELRQEGVV